MYAIVDIETTGSYAAAHGITEISIQVFDGEIVTERFDSLVNPGQPIPRFIQAMTGISDEMVATAPAFEELAPQIHRLLEPHVFVAHNVNFDYSFVKSHLLQHGYSLNSKKLCTVRLSRKIFPGLPTYSLGKLCRQLGITVENRHRAGGDAAATAELFRLLLRNDREGHITRSLKHDSKEATLPPHLPKSHFDQLPQGPGVYYFHDQRGKIIYIGKALNIRQRVSSHFSNNSTSRQKQNFLKHTHGISFQECGTELMACILESAEIKRKWPVFNSSQRRWEDVYGIFLFEDRNGYGRLAIDKIRKGANALHSFHYLADGQALLRKLIREFELCPVLCFLQKDIRHCAGLEEGTCRGACHKKEKPEAYNERLSRAMSRLKEQPSFAILGEGLQPEEQSCILIEKGSFYGMGYIPPDADLSDPEYLREYVTPYRENSFIRNLVMSYAVRHPEYVHNFGISAV